METIYRIKGEKIMKKLFGYLVLFMAVMVTSFVWAQETKISDDSAKIKVNGEAIVNVKPDKVVINFGIEAFDDDLDDAKSKNNKILKKALEMMKEIGIQENEIQAGQLSIEPKWKKEKDREELAGYVARNVFIVTQSNIERVEELITKLFDVGVNYINGISFQTTELKKYQEQARELALKEAKEKAEKMASVLGQFVGDAVEIHENVNESSWYYYSSWWGWGTGQLQEMSKSIPQGIKSGKSEIADVFKLGQISVYANVDVAFMLKK